MLSNWIKLPQYFHLQPVNKKYIYILVQKKIRIEKLMNKYTNILIKIFFIMYAF